MRNRRFIGFVSVAACVSLFPLQIIPQVAEAAELNSTLASKLGPLPTPKAPKEKVEMPKGEFTNAPPADFATKRETKHNITPEGGTLVEQDAFRDVFDNGDGTRTELISPIPVNAKDANGNWRKIDNTFVQVDGRFENMHGILKSSIAANSDAKAIATASKDGHSISFKPKNGKAGVSAYLDKEAVRFNDVFGEADLVYEAGNTQLKETIVLDRQPSELLSYEFTIDAGELTAHSKPDGVTTFSDVNGEVVFTIPRGIAWDSSVQEFNSPVPATITFDSESSTLKVTPDEKRIPLESSRCSLTRLSTLVSTLERSTRRSMRSPRAIHRTTITTVRVSSRAPFIRTLQERHPPQTTTRPRCIV